jgi:hypothetical protein
MAQAVLATWTGQYYSLVRKEGFEPPRPFGHKILSLARLPVPPLPQWWLYSTSLKRAAPLRFWALIGLLTEAGIRRFG